MFLNLPERPGRVSPPVPGLPALPIGWRYERLRSIAELRVSGVDKLTADEELPVRLCNYTDVYKNDYIADVQGYMAATATAAEIARFRLERDDVVITKDSESWTDIAVPAYVTYEAPDFVCAYHLAIIRTRKEKLSGAFLHHALREPRVANQMHTAAGGVTRFGLTQGAIKSSYIPIPPTDEQHAAVKYLGHAHRRIDRAIAAKRRLIALLEEQKQGTFKQAITRGLDPTAPVKDSGIPWLGLIPAHWDCRRAGTVFREVILKSVEGNETPLSMSQKLGLVPSDQVTRSLSSESMVGGKLCEPNDLVLNRLKAHLGVFAVALQSGVVSPDYTVLRPCQGTDSAYYEYVLKSSAVRGELRIRAKGIVEGFWRLYTNDFYTIPLPVPPLDEQRLIVQNLRDIQRSISFTVARVEREIALLVEFRTRLTSDVVTGRVDVRPIAATLPEIGEETPTDLGAEDVDTAVEDAEEFLEEVGA